MTDYFITLRVAFIMNYNVRIKMFYSHIGSYEMPQDPAFSLLSQQTRCPTAYHKIVTIFSPSHVHSVYLHVSYKH